MVGRRRQHESYVSARTNTNRTVTVEPYRAPSDPVYVERNERPKSFGEVRAQWAENVGGGLGAAVVWAAVSVVVHGALYRVGPYLPLFPLFLEPWPNPARVGVAAFVVGALVFGGLMFLRSSLDELVEAGEWNALNQDYDAVEAELADVRAKWQTKYDALLHEYRRLQADYRLHLKAKAPYVAPEDDDDTLPLSLPPARPDNKVLPVQEGAREDAILLMERAYDGMEWSRNVMLREFKHAGWGRGRWESAKEYLVDARVLSYGGKTGNVPEWRYDNLEDALVELDRRDEDKELFMSS